MPLIKSPKKAALAKNIETEMKANPSPSKRKQNIAIAYSVMRQARKKKMAQGGEINFKDESKADADNAAMKRSMEMLDDHETERSQELEATHESMSENDIDEARSDRELDMTAGMHMRHKDEMRAASGMPSADDEDEREMAMLAEGGDIADAIMLKRARTKMMADGGEVDLQDNGNEHLNDEDDMSYEAARKKTYYDDSQLEDQPLASNEHAVTLEDADENNQDMIGSIRKKMKSRTSY